jgi:Xaa-Pro aminopeptidase
MIYLHRYERAIEALNQNAIDAWIIIGKDLHLLREPALLFMLPDDFLGQTALIITAAGDRIALVSGLHGEEATDSGLFSEVCLYKTAADFEKDLARLITRFLPMTKIAINSARCDSSADGLTLTAFQLLKRCLDQAGFSGELVSSAEIMKQVRGRKSDAEIVLIKAAVKTAMAIFDEARSQMRLGQSGLDVQILYQRIIDRRNLGYSWHKYGNPYVSVGTKSSYLCRKPRADVLIEPGDLINVDLGILLDGFASDNQRSFYALRPGEDKPPYEVQHAWKTIQAINAAVCAGMQTGICSDDLTAIGNQVMLDHGFQQGWQGGFGHEISIYAHVGGISAGYNPNQGELDKHLEENMTFTLEPAILTSHGRLCQEEVVQVTAAGGLMLSTPQEEIWLIRAD